MVQTLAPYKNHVFTEPKSKSALKEVLHLLPKKFACFVLYLKIINTFLKINICIL